MNQKIGNRFGDNRGQNLLDRQAHPFTAGNVYCL